MFGRLPLRGLRLVAAGLCIGLLAAAVGCSATPAQQVARTPIRKATPSRTVAPSATATRGIAATPTRPPGSLRQPRLTAEIVPGQNLVAGGRATIKVCWSDIDDRAKSVLVSGGDLDPQKNRGGPGCVNDVYVDIRQEGSNTYTFRLDVASDTGHITQTAEVTVVAAKALRRLATGTFIRDSARDGLGKLTVSNGLSVDAVAVLTDLNHETILSFYIQSKDSFTVSGLEDGTRYLYFTTGEDWDSDAGSFTRTARYSRFADTLVFTTKRTGSTTQYTTFRVTLHAVVGGQAETQPVAPGQFPSPK